MAEIRRWVFLGWTISIWLAWLVSPDLRLSLLDFPALVGYIIAPPWADLMGALHTAIAAPLGAAIVALGTIGAGAVTIRFLGCGASGSGDWFLAMAVGLPVLAATVQSIGLLGLSERYLLAFIAFGGAIRGFAMVRKIGLTKFQGPLWLVWLAGLALVTTGLAALAPAVAWDEAVYHLRAPAIYLLDRKIYQIPEIFLTFLPFNGEMLMMLAKSIGGDEAGRLLHVILWLASGLGASRTARSIWGPKAALWALVLVLTLPIGQVIAARGYVDFFVALPVTAIFMILLDRSNRYGRRKMILAGWLAGAAFGVKYLGGLMAGIIACWRFVRSRKRISAIVPFLLAAALSGGFWLVRNALWTGNPIFPLIWGGPHWSPLDMRGWIQDAAAFNMNQVSVLSAPWRLLLFPSNDGAISPMLLAGLAIPLIMRSRRRELGRIPWFLLAALFLVLLVTSPVSRYLIPAFVLIAAVISGPLSGMGLPIKAGIWMRRVTAIGIAGSLLCGVWAIQKGTRAYYVSLGKISKADYLSDYFMPEGYYSVVSELNRMVPRNGRIYLLGYLHSYGIERRTWFDFLYTRPALYWWLAGAEDPRRIAIRARQSGLTHVVYHAGSAKAIFGGHGGRMEWAKSGMQAYEDFWRSHVREKAQIGNWTIYELSFSPGSHAPSDPVPGLER